MHYARRSGAGGRIVVSGDRNLSTVNQPVGLNFVTVTVRMLALSDKPVTTKGRYPIEGRRSFKQTAAAAAVAVISISISTLLPRI